MARKRTKTKAPRKAASSRGKSRRGRKEGRWYDSNWFLLLIAVLVVVGIRIYRSQQNGDSTPGTAVAPPSADASLEKPAATTGEATSPAKQLDEMATIAVVTEAHGATASDEPIAAARDTAVLRQRLQPDELPGFGPLEPTGGDLAAKVTGSVAYRGLLHDEVVVPTTDRHVCTEHAAGALRASNGYLADVLVWVDAGGEGGTSEATIEVAGCRIGPHTTALRTGGVLNFTSNDGIEHRIVATEASGEERLLAALPPGGEPVQSTAEQPGVFRLSCEHHVWEEAFLLVTDHPHASITDVDGRFDLGAIPLPTSGHVPLQLFHPELGTFEQTVLLQGPLQLEIDLTERAH